MNNKELVLKELFVTNNEYAGYEGICDKLIETWECISTIHASNIFRNGGIHNFVKQEPYDKGVDLIRLSIDKDEIYRSALFKERVQHLINKKKQRLDCLMKEVEELESFVDEFSN